MPILDYESSTTKPPKKSGAAFWLPIGILAALAIFVVSSIIYEGTEYGGTFIVVNLLLWGTPLVLAILAVCWARFRKRKT